MIMIIMMRIMLMVMMIMMMMVVVVVVVVVAVIMVVIVMVTVTMLVTRLFDQNLFRLTTQRSLSILIKGSLRGRFIGDSFCQYMTTAKL